MQFISKNLRVVAIACTMAIACAQTFGQTTSPTTIPSDDLIMLNFPENLDLRIFVQYVSQRLNVNILYDEQVGAQKITIQSPAKIPVSSLMGLLESVLRVKNLALVDSDQPGWKRIVPANNLNAIAQPTSQPAGKVNPGRAVTRLFKLQFADPQHIDQILKPFLTQPGGNSIPMPEKGIIVVTDYEGNMKRLSDLLQLLDQKRDLKTQFVQVKNNDAAQVAQQVTQILGAKARTTGQQVSSLDVELVPNLQTNQIVVIGGDATVASVESMIHAIDVPLGLQTKVYRLQSADPERLDRLVRGLVGPLTVKRLYQSVIDKEGNLLIVTATPDIHTEVESLKNQLDVPMAEQQSPIRFYKLSNATASEVLATIKALEGGTGITTSGIDGEATTQPSVPPNSAGLSGVGNNPAMMQAQRSSFSPGLANGQPMQAVTGFPPGAALLPQDAAISGHESVQTKNALVTADKNTNTIIVLAAPEVQRVYEELIKKLDRRRPQVLVQCTIITIDTSRNFNLGVEISGNGGAGTTQFINFSNFGLSKVDSSTGQLSLQPGLGFNGAVVNADVGQIIVHALQSDSHARVLSSPRILVNDNATGTLESITEQPTSSINASTTVSTTSFGGYEAAGTTVTLTPHISEGDHLSLQYAVSLSTFTNSGSTGDGIPPPRQTDSVQSSVTVPDGSMIIVGGLNRQDKVRTTSSIPLLGEIPLLKYLVSNNTANDSKSKLFVFMRPMILRDDDFADLKYLSEQDLKAAELPGNFPSSEPVVMN